MELLPYATPFLFHPPTDPRSVTSAWIWEIITDMGCNELPGMWAFIYSYGNKYWKNKFYLFTPPHPYAMFAITIHLTQEYIFMVSNIKGETGVMSHV